MPQTISRHSARILLKEKDLKKDLEKINKSLENIDNIIESKKVEKNLKEEITNQNQS